MLKFKKLNLNPKGRKTCDCATRALSECLEISYNEVLDLQLNEVKKHYYGFSSKETIENVLKSNYYIKSN